MCTSTVAHALPRYVFRRASQSVFVAQHQAGFLTWRRFSFFDGLCSTCRLFDTGVIENDAGGLAYWPTSLGVHLSSRGVSSGGASKSWLDASSDSATAHDCLGMR